MVHIIAGNVLYRAQGKNLGAAGGEVPTAASCKMSQVHQHVHLKFCRTFVSVVYLGSRAISPWPIGPRTLSPWHIKSQGPKGRGPNVPRTSGPWPLGPSDLRCQGLKVWGPKVRGPMGQGLFSLFLELY